MLVLSHGEGDDAYGGSPIITGVAAKHRCDAIAFARGWGVRSPQPTQLWLRWGRFHHAPRYRLGPRDGGLAQHRCRTKVMLPDLRLIVSLILTTVVLVVLGLGALAPLRTAPRGLETLRVEQSFANL